MLRPDLIDMSKIYSMIAPLLGVSLFRVLNEFGVNQAAGSMVNSAYQWLLTLNPIVVIILGVIVFFAGKLAKWVGVIMIIVGIIFLALPYLLKLI
jgi:multidrug transporter EmrE-like cation transporter